MRKSYKFKKKETKEKDFAFNHKILAPIVFVIDETGAGLGELTIAEAIRISEERGYDLVEVNPHGKPPVCKIMNYGSFRYQKEKLLKKQKKLTKTLEVKSVRLSIKIGEHDKMTKLGQANKFLEKGHKIKIELILRGREMTHMDLGRDMILAFEKMLSTPVEAEQPITRQGNKLFGIYMPKKEKPSNEKSDNDTK